MLALLLQYALASSSSASLQITINVPAVCELKNNKPVCNLELTQVNDFIWVDTKRGYTVTVIDGLLTLTKD